MSDNSDSDEPGACCCTKVIRIAIYLKMACQVCEERQEEFAKASGSAAMLSTNQGSVLTEQQHEECAELCRWQDDGGRNVD